MTIVISKHLQQRLLFPQCGCSSLGSPQRITRFVYLICHVLFWMPFLKQSSQIYPGLGPGQQAVSEYDLCILLKNVSAPRYKLVENPDRLFIIHRLVTLLAIIGSRVYTAKGSAKIYMQTDKIATSKRGYVFMRIVVCSA